MFGKKTLLVWFLGNWWTNRVPRGIGFQKQMISACAEQSWTSIRDMRLAVVDTRKCSGTQRKNFLLLSFLERLNAARVLRTHFAFYAKSPIKRRNTFKLHRTGFFLRALSVSGSGRLEPTETICPSTEFSFRHNWHLFLFKLIPNFLAAKRL